MNNNPYLEIAREGKNSPWRYAISFFLIIFLTLFCTIVMMGFVLIRESTIDLEQLPPVTILWIAMFPFGFSILGLWIGMRFLHNRRMITLVNPRQIIRVKNIILSALVWLLLCGASDLLMGLMQPGNIVWTFDLHRFLPFMLTALILVPIQILAEELIFRGYLTQMVGLLSSNQWVVILLPGIIFGSLHGMNPEALSYQFVPVMVYYVGMGVFLGWLTLKSQGLELAIGVHLANNLYASLITTFPDSAIPSPALFTYQEYDEIAALIVFIAMVGLYIYFLRNYIKSVPANTV